MNEHSAKEFFYDTSFKDYKPVVLVEIAKDFKSNVIEFNPRLRRFVIHPHERQLRRKHITYVRRIK